MVKPLENILVIALEQAVAAPWCTARLCEAGARVIKIERAGSGDFARGYDTVAAGESAYFVHLNQNKESLVLDIKNQDDQDLLERMLGQADVFVHNLAPGATERCGFGTDRLRKDYPKLITCEISGYGKTADHSMKAYDLLVQAETGLASISGGEQDMGRIGVSICDIGGGMAAHTAILEALLLREKTGQGTDISISLFDVVADWMTVPFLHTKNGNPIKRSGLKHPSIAPYDAFPTQDGCPVLIGIQNELEWKRFCEQVLGVPELAMDQRFCSNNQRVKHREPLNAIIEKTTLQHTQSELIDLLKRAKIAYGRVNDINDFCQHQALQFKQVHTSNEQTVMIPQPPFSFSNQDEKTRTPKLGEHTEQIKQEFLRLS